ncbi:MAG: trypsin-like peptidase domain-containing protein [bacterium]|nr:trypsin-like peptidase domain-containing protein [bacterium]
MKPQPQKPPAVEAPVSPQNAAGNTLDALQRASAGAARDRKVTPPAKPKAKAKLKAKPKVKPKIKPKAKPTPTPKARDSVRSKPGRRVTRDGIPIAQPITGLPLWIKLAGALVAVAVVVVAVMVVMPMVLSSEEKPVVQDASAKKAQELFAEINTLLNSVPYNVSNAEITQLFEWKVQLQKASGKCDEILSLTADGEQERERLADIHRQARQRKRPVSGRIASVEKELFPVVKDSDKPTDMFKRVTPSVPIVRHTRGTGSGFLIEHDGKLWVATNRHVVGGADRNGAWLDFLLGDPSNPNKNSIPIPLKNAMGAIHREADLALIRVPDSPKFQDLIKNKQVMILKLRSRKRPPQVMDNIWTVGHPGNHIALTATKGDITAIKKEYYGAERHHGKVIQITAEITHGNSGCPVFDKYGRVVGVATFGKKGPGGVMVKYAIHVEELWNLLTKPELRLSAEETETMLALNQYRLGMMKSGWKPCNSQVVNRDVKWDGEARQNRTTITSIFSAAGQRQHTVVAVSDSQYKIKLAVVRLTGRKDQTGRPEMVAIKTLEGSGKLVANFKLNSNANCMIIVSGSGSSKSKNYWPVSVEVFRRGP